MKNIPIIYHTHYFISHQIPEYSSFLSKFAFPIYALQYNSPYLHNFSPKHTHHYSTNQPISSYWSNKMLISSINWSNLDCRNNLPMIISLFFMGLLGLARNLWILVCYGDCCTLCFRVWCHHGWCLKCVISEDLILGF